VAITGAGVVTPTGLGYEAFRDSLCRGISGIGAITAFDCADLDTRIAAEVRVPDTELAAWVEPRKSVKLMSRAALFAVAAAAMARRQSRLGPDDVDPLRVGVVAGAGGMGPTDLDLLETQAGAAIESAAARRRWGKCVYRLSPHTASGPDRPRCKQCALPTRRRQIHRNV
jgi:3-oxoacyl-[acyl-carrier-protein] synthase II